MVELQEGREGCNSGDHGRNSGGVARKEGLLLELLCMYGGLVGGYVK